jgi:hypothetical protein
LPKDSKGMWIAGKKTAEIKKINEFLAIIDNDTT